VNEKKVSTFEYIRNNENEKLFQTKTVVAKCMNVQLVLTCRFNLYFEFYIFT
jgi:hypothetical protein